MATPKKQPKKQYYIEAKIKLQTGFEIEAESLDDAIQKGKELGLDDFITILGDHNDSDLRISGAYEVGGI